MIWLSERNVVCPPEDPRRVCGRARKRRVRLGRAAFLALALACAAGTAAAQSLVSTYHADARRRGSYVAPGLDWARARKLHRVSDFAPPIAGHLYAQPLYWQPPGAQSGVLYVATESDGVSAIDAASGKVLWRRAVGKPVPRASLPCGNIDPLGITGTPVIDPGRGAIYFDAATIEGGRVRHLIYALSLKTGRPRPGWPVDVAATLAAAGRNFVARDQNQRGALAILGNRVYVPYGGHYGDCGNYRGWVIGIDLAHPRRVVAWSTRTRGGGIWAPGGIASDGHALFVTTGNTIGAQRWGGGEAVIRLTPDLDFSARPQDFFAPADWRRLDQGDLDLGGTNPLLFDLPSRAGRQHFALVFGKDRRAYLLDRHNLGGIGRALATPLVSARRIITAPAVYPMAGSAFVAFEGRGLNCPASTLSVLKITAGTPPAISTAWCGAIRGRGEPIVTTTDGHSDPIVWMLGAEGDGRLAAFRGDTGARLYQSRPLAGLRHFVTPIAAGGRLYVGADNRLYAFAY